MNEFYVERLANANGDHVVHKDGCPSLPAKDKLHFIGVRSGNAAPLQEAAWSLVYKSAPCPECMAN